MLELASFFNDFVFKDAFALGFVEQPGAGAGVVVGDALFLHIGLSIGKGVEIEVMDPPWQDTNGFPRPFAASFINR